MKFLPIRKPASRAVSSHDSLGRGIEISVSVGVFLTIGLVLDNMFSTRPVLTILLSLFSLIGSFVRLWYVYDTDMQGQEVRRQQAARQHFGDQSVVNKG